MSGLFSAANEANLESFAQEGEKVYQDYEGGSSGNQQQGQQSSGNELQDAETALQGGEKLFQGEEGNV